MEFKVRKIGGQIRAEGQIFMKISKILIFHDFSSTFCISMGIILRVTRASDDEF